MQRALDLLKSAKRPLILLGKGAAYAQADADIRALVEKTGIPYLPMSMAKGLLPDTHEQSAAAARSYVLPEADVVLLIGARLNWLLSHGKGKTWGAKDAKSWGAQKYIQVDISPQEADSNVRIDAPVVGDIGSCVSALLAGIGANWPKPPAEWLAAVAERKEKNIARMAETLAKNPINAYGESKLTVERALPHLERAFGLRWVALRYFNAAGAQPDGSIGEDHEDEIHLIPLAIRAATGGTPLKVFGEDYPTPDGTCLRDYIHVCDLAAAHIKALEALDRGAPSDAFNVGTGTPHSVKAVIDTVGRVVGRPVAWQSAPRRPGDPAVLYASSDRAQRELG